MLKAGRRLSYHRLCFPKHCGDSKEIAISAEVERVRRESTRTRLNLVNHFCRKNVVNQSAAVWPLYARSEGRLIRQARQSLPPLLYLSASVSLSASVTRAAKQQHCDFQFKNS